MSIRQYADEGVIIEITTMRPTEHDKHTRVLAEIKTIDGKEVVTEAIHQIYTERGEPNYENNY